MIKIKILNRKYTTSNRVVVCQVNVECDFKVVTGKGVAKCSENDNFDLSIGRKLSESRAIQDALVKIKNYEESEYNYYKKQYFKYINLFEKIERMFCKEKEHQSYYKDLVESK